MKKFFRKIRKHLINKGKTSRYLKYAFGEIVLVVIGILIALQINEWNKENNRQRAETTILKQLETDLQTSKTELIEIKEFYLKRAQASAEVERAFWKKKTPNDSIIESIHLPRSSRIYSPILGTARSLINSGKIDIISSADFKKNLISYLEKVDYLLKDIQRFEETYYREGVEAAQKHLPNTLWSLENHQNYIDEYLHEIKKSESYNLKLNSIPIDLEKVPFQSNLKELFQNKEFYIAYRNFYIGHENIYLKYDEILSLTTQLLDKINQTEITADN